MIVFSRVLLIVLLDQLSKWAVLTQLSPGESLPVLPPFFYFTLIHNTGIAFGLFQGRETILFILITLSLVVLSWIAYRVHTADGQTKTNPSVRPSRLAVWGITLILAGAIGNWLDRIRFHAVIDFLDFRIWPVFNLADSAITIGVGLYLILLLRKP